MLPQTLCTRQQCLRVIGQFCGQTEMHGAVEFRNNLETCGSTTLIASQYCVACVACFRHRRLSTVPTTHNSSPPLVYRPNNPQFVTAACLPPQQPTIRHCRLAAVSVRTLVGVAADSMYSATMLASNRSILRADRNAWEVELRNNFELTTRNDALKVRGAKFSHKKHP